MLHLGDITKISGRTAPVVDVVIGGSPCQDLSVAGLRAGLDGARSGLFMHQLRIVREMREEDAKRGRTGSLIRPRYMVWENVPGTFSSTGGRDFQAVLTEIVRVVQPSAPDVPMPRGGWPTAGCLYDDLGRWSVAWRVHDAQFWGVPQRRRRISVVADFGGLSAPEILFERKGLSGDFEAVGAPREAAGPAPGAGPCLAVGFPLGFRAENTKTYSEVATTLCSGTRPGFCNGVICMASAQSKAEIMTDLSPSILAGHDQPIVLTFSDGAANALKAKANLSHRADSDTLILVAAFKSGQGSKAGGLGLQEEVSPTLAASESGNNQVPAVLVYDARGNGDGQTVPTLTGDHENRVTDYTALVLAVDCRNGTVDPNINGTLQAKSTGGQSLNLNNVVLTAIPQEPVSFDLSQVTSPVNKSKGSVGTAYSLASTGRPAVLTTSEDVTILLDGQPCVVVRLLVRRLTPLECERLQGYPDGWTDIGPWVDSKGKLHEESSDSARYTRPWATPSLCPSGGGF